MEILWNKEAKEEFLDLEKEIQEEINKYKDKLPEKGLKWEKVGLVFDSGLDLEAFKLKINPEDKEEINHRLIFDVEKDSYVVYKVGERPDFYDSDNLEGVNKRKQD